MTWKVIPNDRAAFHRYIGIDYSGAETPTSSLKGLRIYVADRESPPVEVLPPPSPRKYWTRRGIAEWLAERLSEDPYWLLQPSGSAFGGMRRWTGRLTRVRGEQKTPR